MEQMVTLDESLTVINGRVQAQNTVQLLTQLKCSFTHISNFLTFHLKATF